MDDTPVEGARPRRLLSIATLYPTPRRPAFGRFVARQLHALAARDDWDVTVINPIGLPPVKLARYADVAATVPFEQDGDLAVHHVPFTLVPGLSGRFNPALIARAVLPLARKLHAEHSFDLVDAQFFYPDGPAAMRIADALGLPLAIKARGSDIHVWGGNASARKQMLAAADRAAVLLSVSHALARDMAALGMDRGKIAVHYTGLDHDRFKPLPRAAARQLASAMPDQNIPVEGRLLLSVGALIRIKGQSLAIEALAQLPADVRLALAGTGENEPVLRALAARLDLAERVHFLGAVGHETLPALLSAGDVMVLPSEREGLANAWIEALACGTPLVIPDVGGAREVVNDPVAGRIVERTPTAIADAVRDLLADPPAQDAVAASAARFSWDANAAALAGFYTAAVVGRAPAID
ncbi:glycosyltransferase [Novosphingobium lentum]|uniref:glycosyltransferase n=1 Tax=Novosphingobium lentum TaxID=145287 RepID=UPI000833020C|nr:glycosyltransferase [Novosphingobium lentum]